MTDGAAHDAPQHVATLGVRREHAVADEERHRAGVLGEDPQRHIGRRRAAGSHAGQFRGFLNEPCHLVDLEDRVDALQQGQHPLEAGAGVDARLGKGHHGAAGLLLELHEHQIPVLHVALVATVGRAAPRTVLLTLVEEDLRARTAGPGVTHAPEVVLVEALDALGRHTHGVPPDLGSLVVAEVHGDPEPLGVEAEALGGQLPRPGDGVGLEVVAEAEVAEHLEEAEVPLGAADLVEVVLLAPGPHALLHRRGALVRGRLGAHEVGLEGHHSGDREQERRVVRYEAGRGDDRVVALGEEAGEDAAQLACCGSGHGVALAWCRVCCLLPRAGFRIEGIAPRV